MRCSDESGAEFEFVTLLQPLLPSSLPLQQIDDAYTYVEVILSLSDTAQSRCGVDRNRSGGCLRSRRHPEPSCCILLHRIRAMVLASPIRCASFPGESPFARCL